MLKLTLGLFAALLIFEQMHGESLDELFAQDPLEPGCAVGYAREGKIEYLKGFGIANLEHGIPITPTTRFHIASISKELTGAAVGILILEGKLTLDDDVRSVLPEVPEFEHPITIRHLLHHSSGLANHTRLMPVNNMDYGNAYTQQEMLDLVFAEGLAFKPGTKFEYGASYLLLGKVVERLTDLPLREYLKKHIFEPLGMKSSGLHDDFSLIPNRAEGYLDKDGVWINDRVRYGLTGSGGVHMTISDLLLWNHASRNDLLVEGLAELLYESPAISVTEELQYHFGFTRTTYQDERATVHSGSYQGTRTLLYAFEPGYATAVSCNHRADVRAMTIALRDKIVGTADEDISED